MDIFNELPSALLGRPWVLMTGWPGRKGAKWALTPIGPIPGPPPPWGIQKVLCKFKWHTSAPINPGAVSPTFQRKNY